MTYSGQIRRWMTVTAGDDPNVIALLQGFPSFPARKDGHASQFQPQKARVRV